MTAPRARRGLVLALATLSACGQIPGISVVSGADGGAPRDRLAPTDVAGDHVAVDRGAVGDGSARDAGSAPIDVPPTHLDAMVMTADTHPAADVPVVRADVPATRDAPPPPDVPAAVDPVDPSRAPFVDTTSAHYPPNVWITDAMAKVQPLTPPGTDHWALLSSARNEFEDFQVHVRAGTAAITNLAVGLSDLVDARSGAVLHAADHAVVFRAAYQTVTTPSDLNGSPGTYPDALIPAVDSLVHEPRWAFPATVPPGETRSYWVEVFVPPGTPSGWYLGTVAVTSGTTLVARLPVRLKVWNFDLPSTSSLPNFFAVSELGMCDVATGGYDNCGAFPGAGGSNDHGVEVTHLLTARMLLDYRLTNAETVYAGTDVTDWTSFDALYGPLLDGTAATRLHGARMSSLAYVGRVHDYTLAGRWFAHATARGWADRMLYYHCDEPPQGCTFAAAAMEEQGIHAISPSFHTLLTTDVASVIAHGMTNDVDIVTPEVFRMHPRDGVNTRPQYDSFLAQPNHRLWWYQSCSEHESCDNGTPGPLESTWATYMVDATPVRNRVFQWLAFVYGVGGELYYGLDYCWNNACGDGSMDPWTSVYAFGGHGDGTMLYPGLPSRIGGTTPIPLPSVRLQLVRAGMEDYEYLHALAAAGDGAFAAAQAATFITNAFTFNNDPRAMLAAREAVGSRLHARTLH